MTEEELNHLVAVSFIKEYALQTGRQLRIVDCSQDFPDVVLEDAGGSVGMELVSIPLAFLLQQSQAHSRFIQAASERLSRSIPEIWQYALGFQFISTRGEHPILLPKSTSGEWKAMLLETEILVRGHLERISSLGAMLLVDASLAFGVVLPTLRTYFDGVFLRRCRPGEDSTRGPLLYTDQDVHRVIQDSLSKKRAKRYKADILLLHTFPKVDDFLGSTPLTLMGMLGSAIPEAAQRILALEEHKPTLEQFKEIWLLNKIIDNDKRLFRIAPL